MTKTRAEIRAEARRSAAILLEGCRQRYEAGDKGALLAAINWCAVFDVRLPSWVASAFRAAFKSTVSEFGSRSWDTTLGKPHGDRKVERLRTRKEKRWPVYSGVLALRAKQPKPKGDILQIVAKEFHISRPTAKRWFDECAAELKASFAYGERMLADTKTVQENGKVKNRTNRKT